MEIVRDQELLDWRGATLCWFCEARPPVHGKSSVVSMSKVTDGEGGRLRMLESTVMVPRCADCRSGHLRVMTIGLTVALLGAVAAFLVFVVWKPIEMPGWAMGTLVFLGLAPGCVMIGGAFGLPAGQKPERDAETFSSVLEMKRGGWEIKGSTPKQPGP